MVALEAPDYLVRKKAFDLLRSSDPEGSSQTLTKILNTFVANKQNTVLPFSPLSKTRLGQILNSDADYARAISRRNGETRAIIATTKGKFVIELLPEDAPLTVENFIKLARRRYFDRVYVHRVVPNFVIQDGDQRGDGNGGPGWQIRCEINMVPYERGAVGMALSGKDTGGSQWFITHSPQPHLDGGYTVFGKVTENDMKIVDAISRGDKILEIKIIEAGQEPTKDRPRRRR
jgi:cyclophilin family peptidyl-prolyl cis-trans isomerase